MRRLQLDINGKGSDALKYVRHLGKSFYIQYSASFAGWVDAIGIIQDRWYLLSIA